MRFTAPAIVLAALAWTSAAAANPDIGGYSGKEYNGDRPVCTTSCHAKGVTPTPTLEITAPATIKAGEKGNVTVVVNGTRKATLINAAFTNGVVSTAGQNTVQPFPGDQPDEIAAGKSLAGADGTFKFSFVPPNRNGKITLYVTGMSTNLDGSLAGDAIKSETREITVTDATPEPADAGATSSSSSTSSSSGGTTKPRDAGASGDDDDDDSTAGSTPPEEGCAATRSTPSDAAPALLAVGVALVLLRTKRRR